MLGSESAVSFCTALLGQVGFSLNEYMTFPRSSSIQISVSKVGNLELWNMPASSPSNTKNSQIDVIANTNSLVVRAWLVMPEVMSSS